MFTVIGHHSYGRDRILGTLVYHDHSKRPCMELTVARSSGELVWGMTVLEAARTMLATLLEDVDRQLAQEGDGADPQF